MVNLLDIRATLEAQVAAAGPLPCHVGAVSALYAMMVQRPPEVLELPGTAVKKPCNSVREFARLGKSTRRFGRSMQLNVSIDAETVWSTPR